MKVLGGVLTVAAAVAISLVGAAAPARAGEESGRALASGQQVASMATTSANRYAVMKDGTLWGWGNNDYGQLGIGNQKDSQTPVRITGGVKQVSAYEGAVLAVKTDGTVWSWGSNNDGQLGNGNANDQRVPMKVSGLSGIKSVLTESGHSFAIGSDGSLFAWGDNTFHALGTAKEDDILKPVKVASGVKQVDASGYDVRVVKSNGDLYGFGSYWSESTSSSYYQKKLISNIKEAYVYGDVTYAIANDGWLWAWGYNGNGLIGDGTTTNRDRPVRVLKDVKQVTGTTAYYSNYAVAALKRDGTVWTWGDNEYGQLGIGNVASGSWSPKKVASLSGVASISATAGTMFAVTSGGSLYAWGEGQFGSLGNGTDTYKQFTPVKVMGSVRSLYGAGSYTAYAVMKDGSLWGWGADGSGNATFGIPDTYLGEEWPQHIMFGRPQTKTRGFADLKKYDWTGTVPSDWVAKEGWLGYAVDNGLMTGLNPADHGGKKLFDPYGKVTRAQVATVLYRLAGSPKYKAPAKDFADNRDKSSWYYDEVRWAASAGVVTGLRNADGSYTRFAPDNDIWRQDLAVMMQRYAQKVAKVKTDTSEAKASRISGWDKVSGYAKQAVAWSVNAGLMGGVNTDKGKQLQPDVTTDRSALAKTASVLKRDVIG